MRESGDEYVRNLNLVKQYEHGLNWIAWEYKYALSKPDFSTKFWKLWLRSTVWHLNISTTCTRTIICRKTAKIDTFNDGNNKDLQYLLRTDIWWHPISYHHPYLYLKLVYDRSHYFGLGPIPKPKPKLADNFGRYHNQYRN